MVCWMRLLRINMTPTPNCERCGRFLSYKEMHVGGGASWVFVPDTDVPTYEESRWRCRRCTEKHGPDQPFQRVVVEKCSGVT